MNVRSWSKKVSSDRALLLTTTDDEDFPSPVNADAVKRYFVKRDPLDKKNKRVQAKKGIQANQEKREKVRAKIRDKREKLYTRQVENPTKATWAKKGYPGGSKIRKGGPAKRGIETNNCA